LIKKFLKKFPPQFKDFIDYHLTSITGAQFSLNGLDRKLAKYLNYREGFYVELGANNGFKQSNTLFLEKKLSWRGILIEPSLSNYLSCVYYRERRNSIFCCACVPFDYGRRYVEMEYADLMTVSRGLASDIDNVDQFLKTSSHFGVSATYPVVKFAAEARTLSDCLSDAGAPKSIDFLSLDVEGAELSVLQGIDFSKYQFKHILVESRTPDNIAEFLRRYGYRLTEKLTFHDYLFSFDGFGADVDTNPLG